MTGVSTILLTSLALLTAHAQPPANPLTLEVQGVGTITVNPDVEPAQQVIRLARAASSKGLNSLKSKESLTKIYNYFCSKRACAMALPDTLTLTAPLGTIVCEPWEEPANLVQQYALKALEAGFKLSEQDLTPLLEKICASTICLKASYRLPEEPQSLNVEGIGKIVLGAFDEPADVVEIFAQKAIDAGLNVDGAAMKQIMEYFCAKRKCNRLQLKAPTPNVKAIDLTIEGVGKMTCLPQQDPADIVEDFARQAVAAGFPIGFQEMKQMMEYFCSRRECKRVELNVPEGRKAAAAPAPPVPQPIDLNIEGIGKMTCLPQQDPADIVEDFARQAVAAGFPIGFQEMKQMMEYFCSRRECKRVELNVPEGK